MNALTTLPDIAGQTREDPLALDWVGMCGIALPVRLDGERLMARADAGVDLADGAARGIHMSRLYLALERLEHEPLSPASLRRVLEAFLDSHSGLSTRAQLRLRTEALLQRPALVSTLSGWKAYPLQIDAGLDARGFHVELRVEIGYSSTCPCSAALARQLIQQRFADDFSARPPDHEAVLAWLGSDQGIVATPHSQRSTAQVRVRLHEDCACIPLKGLVDPLEQALGTALQTAVKRADEQAFALANGQNPMFCEDAARRLHQALRRLPDIDGFHLRVEHAESLHAHDAVAESSWNWRGD
ncbi:GTP cyclohydrolase FolE2 [Zestomonas carbonaria]|uniref:GTP cyclohydrolase FolE2 n=1 Tax=Zestomonas carbonaria TaxID=2762745 RepID=A0A7U7I8X3_9GAMM|nr:GTP cyclohydrolase FolE2 [Pseudomonas carbonaria]CAD5107121.1 GTP cyclohydrolase FolE2 [Pseudomonas carbonaria]